MNLTIVAATGGIGRHLLEQAVAGGHRVTAVVRDPARLARQTGAVAGARPLPVPELALATGRATNAASLEPEAPGTRLVISVVATDLAAPDPATLEGAVHGADAVLSALGPRSPKEIGIAERGTRAIVEAMQATGVRRILAVGAAPVSTVPSPDRPDLPPHDPGDGFFMCHLLGPMLKAVLGRRYADLARMEGLLRESALEWTVIRPPQLTDGPLTQRFRTARGTNLRRGLRVSRADVAHCMLQALEQPDTVNQTVGVAN
ncbi:MAG TPA: NAD(P)H-binding protein [Gaiellaceae bacterium]|nr:NAD(P)H-binding protein [Gaiellaceae bacterium]